jgi:predicted deacylase
MIINGVEIALGEEKVVDVNIARLPSHTPIDVSITIARATEPGPVLLLMGGLHGDEINGSEIVRRMIEKNDHLPKIGTVICIPIINVYGFIYFSRYVPDGKDVNRSFPGNKNGSFQKAWRQVCVYAFPKIALQTFISECKKNFFFIFKIFFFPYN